MNGSNKVFYAALTALILCFLPISLLLPALFNSINEQAMSTQRIQLLSAEIYDIQKYHAQAAYFPEDTAPKETTAELSKIEAEYKTARAENILNTLITAIQAFFTWLIIAFATRLFNDYLYPCTHAFIQRKWKQCGKKLER